MSLLVSILLILLGFVVFLGVYMFLVQKRHAEYFKKRGIPYIGGLVGAHVKLFTGSINLIQMEGILYEKLAQSQAPMVGFSDLTGGSNLIVSDPEILKNILVRDFNNFVNRRGLNVQECTKYFKKMIFAAKNEQWKGIRAKLSPTFTTGRIRRMFQIFKTSSENMTDYLRDQMGYPMKKTVDVDFFQLLSKFSMDVIASCAFGIDSKAWELPPDKSSTFEKMGSQFGIHFSIKTMLRFFVMMLTPKIANLLEIDALDGESQYYFAEIVKEVIKRRKSGERRDDFLQLMLDAQQNLLKADEETAQVMNGSVEGSGENLEATEDLGKLVSLDDDTVTANAMLFLLGGFDNIHSLLLFTVYSLALEPDVQEKLYEEVTSVLGKHGGELSYDVIPEMTYLDMVINESMRLYPPATKFERTCNEEYHVPGTNLVIEKDIVIVVPVMGIHRDPKNFPNPEKFMPERFSPENKAGRHPYVFLPFGHGPRNCIGMRFAVVEVKAVLIQLIQSYCITPCAKTTIPVKFGPNMTLKPKHGMWLNVSSR